MLSPAEEAEVLRLAVAQGHLRAEPLSALASSEGDRALAAQGLLLLVRAKSTRGAVAQQAAQQAAAAMHLMGQGNPLLLKFYAREIADIDRLAGPSVRSLTSL